MADDRDRNLTAFEPKGLVLEVVLRAITDFAR